MPQWWMDTVDAPLCQGGGGLGASSSTAAAATRGTRAVLHTRPMHPCCTSGPAHPTPPRTGGTPNTHNHTPQRPAALTLRGLGAVRGDACVIGTLYLRGGCGEARQVGEVGWWGLRPEWCGGDARQQPTSPRTPRPTPEAPAHTPGHPRCARPHLQPHLVLATLTFETRTSERGNTTKE